MKKHLITVLVVALVSTVAILTARASSFPSDIGEENENTPSAQLNYADITDLYLAAANLEKDAQAIMDASAALKRGTVGGVELTLEQKEAIKETGYGGLYKAYTEYIFILQILDINQQDLIDWEVSNPQIESCYPSLGCGPTE